MSERWASLEACQRKVRHKTESKALAAASRSAARCRKKGLHVYHCPHCRGWHLTSQARHARG